MKKSNRKKFLQFVVLVLFLAALFVPQDANRLLIAGIALIGIGVTLFSYLLPLFTERLKNREHKLRKRPERTRHLEGTPDLETILWSQMMTIESLHKKEPSEGNPDSRPAVNPKSWYSLIGKPLLMELVGDLQARGYEKLFINEQGDVYILNGTEPEVRGKLEHFPPKDYWGELTEIFTEDELTTEETEQALELSWIS